MLSRASRSGQFETLVYHSAIDPKQVMLYALYTRMIDVMAALLFWVMPKDLSGTLEKYVVRTMAFGG